jgi:hypothetical protein
MQKSAIRGFWTICKIANIYAGRMNFRAFHATVEMGSIPFTRSNLQFCLILQQFPR